jgi:hypothetical protein
VKKGRKRGEGVWLGIALVFSGMLFPDVIFESLLFPADDEAYVFVEFHVVCRKVD